VGLKSLKSLNLTNGYPKNNNKVKSKPLELYELAGKNEGGNGPKSYVFNVDTRFLNV
jgi:hypothetical protein